MLEFIKTNLDNIFILITSIIATASAVSALTPNATDDKIVAFIKKVSDFLALNLGNAKTTVATEGANINNISETNSSK